MATRTIATATALKRADALAVGDIIPGGNAPKGHLVQAVKHGIVDDMLGMVTRVTVVYIAIDAAYQNQVQPRTYTFRPYDKIWVEA